MTQTTLFDPIWHGPELEEGWDDWTPITWSGRSYRWRLDTVREYPAPLSDYVDRASPTIRFELEYMSLIDGAWRVVRNHTTRDDVWASLNLNEAAEVAD